MKTGIDHFRERVDWNQELREYIAERIEEEEKKELLEKLDGLIETLPPSSKGTASMLIREDRDGH